MKPPAPLARRADRKVGAAKKLHSHRRWLSVRLALVVLLASAALALVGIPAMSTASTSPSGAASLNSGAGPGRHKGGSRIDAQAFLPASEVKQAPTPSSDIVSSSLPDRALSSWLGVAAMPQPTIGPPEEESSGDQDDPDLSPGSHLNKEEYLKRRNEYFAMLRGYDPDQPFDPLARGRALRELQQQEKFQAGAASSEITPALNLLTWTPIGPAPIPQGHTQIRRDPVSGRTVALAVHPTNPNIVYAGTAAGGVWRSTNGGANWTPIFDNADSLAIGALAIAPSQPSTLYVGTGEIGMFFGVGVYRIDNADSATPTLVGPINPVIDQGDGITRGAFQQVSISEILVHPTDPATIFVATAFGFGGLSIHNASSPNHRAVLGIYRSTNATAAAASVNFTKLTVNTNGGFAKGDTEVTDMVLEPGNANRLICWVRGSDGPPNAGGIYKSTNALSATPTFAQKLTNANYDTRGELAINKVGDKVTVYAATGEAPLAASNCAGGEDGKLRRSNDGGETWPDDIVPAGGFCGGQCFYDIAIEMDPTNANNIQLGGSRNGTCSVIVKRSTDGNTFSVDATGLHADTHVFAYAPSNPQVVYTGNDGGVWKSTDGGATWTSLNTAGFSATQFVSIALHPTDREFMIGGTQDNGTELRRPDGTWSQIASGDGGYTLIDRNATNPTNVTIYHTFYNRTNPGGQIEFERVDLTADAEANTWQTFGCPGGDGRQANGINCDDRVLFYAPMALGPGNPNTVYFGTDRLYRSTDKGVTMTVVGSAGALSGTSPLSSISISPQSDNVRAVGLRNGLVFATTSGGTLTDISPPNRPPGAAVGRVYIDPTNPNTLYVTYGGFGVTPGQHIFKTINLSAGTPTWADSGNGIPDVPVNAITVDKLTPNNLWAGTDIGVYRSIDGGANWTPFNSGLPRVPVFDIGFQEQGQTNPLSGRVLRIGTYGRGIWEIQIGGAAPTPTPSPCTGSNRLQDPGLEMSTGDGPMTNPKWESTSTKYGSSLCSSAVCGNASNGKAVPRNGTHWVWFGGAEGPETGTLKQTAVIPSGGPAQLNYYLKVSRVYAHSDVLKVKIDGNTIETVPEPAVEDSAYVLHSLNLARYADGGSHTILFEFSGPGLGRTSTFNVDDITLEISCPVASPTPTPSPTPALCEGGNKAKDSSLEASIGNSFPLTNPNWEATSTNFASSLCSSAVCGNGSNGQAVPRTGKFWAWFGGSDGPETSTLRQKVLIPSGAGMSIGYYLKISRVYSPFAGRLKITVDGNAIQTITEPSTAETAYTFHSVPVPAGFADGRTHTIGFDFDSANSGKVSSFNVDDITFSVVCPPGQTGGPQTVQFSGENYLVREGSGAADLIVTRTGDSSSSVSVNFATGDDNGTQLCSVKTGLASSRCDYMQTSGTLRFEIGETSKTISVPISDDGYTEGNESFAVTLSSPVGAALGAQSTTTVNIADNRAAGAANPMDNSSPHFFVRQHYLDFLNREPDTSGWDFWGNQITSCNFDLNCIQVRRVNVSAAYFLSIEFQHTGYLVERMYKSAYGNLPHAPVPIKFSEFLLDTQEIGDGIVVGRAGWEATLESNKQAFASEFISRSRFASAFPTSMTPAQFVDRLNTNSGNVLTASDRAAAIALFNGESDTANTMARAQVLRQVAENQNLYKAEYNRAFVLMQYFGYLRRDPNSGPDTDFGGYNFWLDKLNQFNGDYIRAEMVKGFIDSSEYRARFGP